MDHRVLDIEVKSLQSALIIKWPWVGKWNKEYDGTFLAAASLLQIFRSADRAPQKLGDSLKIWAMWTPPVCSACQTFGSGRERGAPSSAHITF